MATTKEIQEMDISLLLELPSWLEDECEFDIINLNKYVYDVWAVHRKTVIRKCDSFKIPMIIFMHDQANKNQMAKNLGFLVCQEISY